ncbi:MAG: cupin domain-containing protein [Blastocatellia bacterium]
MSEKKTELETIQEQAALYALGALGQHETRAFEAALAGPDAYAAGEARAFEALLGDLSLAAPPVAPPVAAREKLMARIATETPAVDQVPAQSPAMDRAMKEIFHVRINEGAWVPHSEGIEAKVLFTDAARGSISTLIRMQPGAAIERHRHAGVEECLVLEGDFHIGEQEYGPGDYQCALPGSLHERVFTNHGAMALIISNGYEFVA